MEDIETILEQAVLAGRRLDWDGGAGVPARLRPVIPTLVGAAALPLPLFDAEADSF